MTTTKATEAPAAARTTFQMIAQVFLEQLELLDDDNDGEDDDDDDNGGKEGKGGENLEIKLR